MDGPVLIHIALVAMMIGVSLVGFRYVPDDHRFRIRFGGFSGPEGTIGKTSALVTYPALGAVITWGTALAADSAGPELPLLGVAALGLLLLVQISAVRSAAR